MDDSCYLLIGHVTLDTFQEPYSAVELAVLGYLELARRQGVVLPSLMRIARSTRFHPRKVADAMTTLAAVGRVAVYTKAR
jgi:hypothetical protein